MKRWALASVALLVMGCPRDATTLPDPSFSGAVRAQIALGRLDDLAGDPVSERARLRRLAEHERARGSFEREAGRRLFSLHALAVRLARSDAERDAALAELRTDEALLLELAAHSDAISLFDLANIDATLYARHPTATRAAIEYQTAHMRARDELDVTAFSQTLPIDLYTTLYAHGLVQDTGPLERAESAVAMGPLARPALERMLPVLLERADIPRADAAAARLLEIDPSDLRARIFRLAVARREPLPIERDKRAYRDALLVLDTPADHGQLAATALGWAASFARERAEVDARALLDPLRVHPDEPVRTLAHAVACEMQLESDCRAPEITEAGRIRQAFLAGLVREAEHEQEPDCWDQWAPAASQETGISWDRLLVCAESTHTPPPDRVFEILRRTPLPYAPRALAFLASVSRTDAPLGDAYAALRIEVALASGDLADATRTYETLRPLLSRQARTEYALLLADARSPTPDSDARALLHERGEEVDELGRHGFDATFEEVFEVLEAEGCAVPAEGEGDEIVAEPGHLLAAYERAFDYDPADLPSIVVALEQVAGHLPPEEATYVLGIAALQAVRAGDLGAMRRVAGRVHSLARGSYIDHAVTLVVARASDEMDVVRAEARNLVLVDPDLYPLLSPHVRVATTEWRPPVSSAREPNAACQLPRATLEEITATGAPAADRELAWQAVEADYQQRRFLYDRLTRVDTRDPSSLLLRCVIAYDVVFEHDAPFYVLPASPQPTRPSDAEYERTRRIADVCERVPTSRHSETSLAAWARALYFDEGPSRAMLEAFVRASATSTTFVVRAMRIRALVRLERFGEARQVFVRAEPAVCSEGSMRDLLGREERALLAPDLGFFARTVIHDEPALIAVLRGRWALARSYDGLDPMLSLVVDDAERGLLDRFSTFALSTPFRGSDVQGVLRAVTARSPRSLAARAFTLSLYESDAREPACGNRAACIATARELLAHDEQDVRLASAVATFYLAIDEVAEARRILVRALEAHPDDRALREMLESRCGGDEATVSPDASCARAYACCVAYVRIMGGGTSEMNPREICQGVRTAGEQGQDGAPACEAATSAWRQALSSLNHDVPPRVSMTRRRFR